MCYKDNDMLILLVYRQVRVYVVDGSKKNYIKSILDICNSHLITSAFDILPQCSSVHKSLDHYF